ncbi:MAG: alpha/beta hydrolase [Alistipes sp.]|nr:alpha/beta hydrolase [Alistipes sp.]
MKQILTILLSLSVAITATAQKRVVATLEQSGADEIVHYWDNSTAPHSNGITDDETINARLDMSQTSSTDFYIYKADPTKAIGQGVVVIPGGGYYKLSMQYDGFKIAQYLRSIGVTAIVVKYRLPNGVREVPIEDAIAGLRYMREQAEVLGIDPEQVGMLGCSAGGHLTALATHSLAVAERPKFNILIYPSTGGDVWSNYRLQNCFERLLGKWRTQVDIENNSCENLVTPDTPPTLLMHTHEDTTVPSTITTEYYKALKHHGVRSALYLYPAGAHGWAGHDEWHYAEPAKRAIADWLEIEKNRK